MVRPSGLNRSIPGTFMPGSGNLIVSSRVSGLCELFIIFLLGLEIEDYGIIL